MSRTRSSPTPRTAGAAAIGHPLAASGTPQMNQVARQFPENPFLRFATTKIGAST